MPVHELYDFLSQTTTRQDIISEGILPERSRLVIGALPKVGKTTLVTQLALELASGTPFLGLFDIPRPTPVLLVEQELGEDTYRERVTAAKSRFFNIQQGFLIIANEPNLQIDASAGRSELTKMITAWRPHVVILDPMYKLHSVNEDKAYEMQSRLFNVLDDIIRQLSVSIVLVHHKRKPFMDRTGRQVSGGFADLRGTGQTVAWADSILVMEQVKRDQIILSFLLRHGDVDPVVLTPDWSTFYFSAQPQSQPTGPDEQAIMSLLRATPGQKLARATLVTNIAGVTGHSERQIQRALSSLRIKAFIGESGSGRSRRTIHLMTAKKEQWLLLE